MVRVTSEQAKKHLMQLMEYIDDHDYKIDQIFLASKETHTAVMDHDGSKLDREDEDNIVIHDMTKMNLEINIRFEKRVL